MSTWIETEIAASNMSDKRLNNRLKRILTTLSKDPQKSIPNNCKTWSSTQATYRFLSNPSVSASDYWKNTFLKTVNMWDQT